MGRNFLITALFVVLTPTSFGQGGQILPPSAPKLRPPPSRGQAGADEDLARKRKWLDKQTGRNTKKPERSVEQKQKLLKETLKPRPMVLSLMLAPVYTHITTSGSEREDYTADPGLVVHGLWRLDAAKKTNKPQLYTGLRTGFFAGSGKYKGRHARFSFTYFGPMIGIGKIDLATRSVGRDTNKSERALNRALAPRSGYFAAMGIAAQSRTAAVGRGEEEAEDDIDTNALTFDSPGIWLDVRYTWIFYNALGVNLVAGVQSGEKKYIGYGGVGVSAWH